MSHRVLLTTFIFLAIPLAGCMGGDTDENSRIHEFELVVNSGTSDTVSLYTMNDGESQMNVVAMGFMRTDQDVLEIPNPTIRVQEGDTVILTVTNNNPLPHTFHLHGGLVPWEMDGVPFLTQMPIHIGESYTYTYENMKAGTYFYHCHVDVAHHMDLGMYGAFIVEERDPTDSFDQEYTLMLDEWDNCHVHGNTDPVDGSEQSGEFSNRVGCIERFLQDNVGQNQVGGSVIQTIPEAQRQQFCDSMDALPAEIRDQLPDYQRYCVASHFTPPPQQATREWYYTTFPVYAPIYNTYLINGKAFPDTTPIVVEHGDTIKLRLINVGEQLHSMHLHGHTMKVTHRDGYELATPFYVDTLSISPGERYDVVFEANNPGYWAFHDHIGLHVMNDDVSPGGMFTCVAYDDFHGRDAYAFEKALDCNTEAVAIIAEGGTGHDGHN